MTGQDATHLAPIAERFRSFVREAHGYGRFYEELGPHIADDPAILALAAKALPGQPNANILFAAVQYLVLRGTDHPLAAHYAPATAEPAAGHGEAAWPDFRGFCHEHAAELTPIIESRRVQTNEVGRCAVFRPALHRIAARTGRPLALVEVGASAGLLLLFDRYAYAYRLPDGSTFEAGEGPVRLSCELRGEAVPLLEAAHPPIAARVGIDLNPLDPTDPDDALWLRALVWPDQPARAERLRLALEVAAADPPRILAGDALDLVPAVLRDLPRDATPVVYHAWTVNQFSEPDRRRFETLLMEAGRERAVFRLSLEPAEPEWSAIDVYEYADGESQAVRLAHAHPHGAWLEWLP